MTTDAALDEMERRLRAERDALRTLAAPPPEPDRFEQFAAEWFKETRIAFTAGVGNPDPPIRTQLAGLARAWFGGKP